MVMNALENRFIKEMIIFDVILNTKVTCKRVLETTIVKCFMWCSLHEHMDLAQLQA